MTGLLLAKKSCSVDLKHTVANVAGDREVVGSELPWSCFRAPSALAKTAGSQGRLSLGNLLRPESNAGPLSKG